jgi:hypothetical protein
MNTIITRQNSAHYPSSKFPPITMLTQSIIAFSSISTRLQLIFREQVIIHGEIPAFPSCYRTIFELKINY